MQQQLRSRSKISSKQLREAAVEVANESINRAAGQVQFLPLQQLNRD